MMIRLRVVLVVLPEIVKRRNLSVVVVACDRQDWNVDARVVLLVRRQGLPVRIEGRVLEPALEEPVGRAVDLIYFAVRPTARVPTLVERLPALPVGVGLL